MCNTTDLADRAKRCGLARELEFHHLPGTLAMWLILALAWPAGDYLRAAEAGYIAPSPGWDNLQPAMGDANDWPWWRGPSVNNHAPADQKPPVKWSEQENIRWRITPPGRGHATPCVLGERIYLPAGDPAQQAIWLLCYDRATGQKIWQAEVYHGPLPKIHEDNSYASATPACDGERIFFPYQAENAVCLAAVDLSGKVIWNKQVAPFKSIQGYSASPVLYKSAVIIPTDGTLANTMTALHRQTGEVIWHTTLSKVRESYASPLAARVAGRDQIVIIGGFKTSSYDPNTGRRLWECDGPAEFCAATMAFDASTVFATGGYPEKALLAIRADGSGDITRTHVAWKSDTKAGYVPSPLYHAGLLYAVSDNGLMRAYEAGTGKIAWEHAFKAPFYSSPVLVGDRLYLFDRQGLGHIVKTGSKFESVGTNRLPQGVFATPVILGGRIYLRSLTDFYCLEEKP